MRFLLFLPSSNSLDAGGFNPLLHDALRLLESMSLELAADEGITSPDGDANCKNPESVDVTDDDQGGVMVVGTTWRSHSSVREDFD